MDKCCMDGCEDPRYETGDFCKTHNEQAVDLIFNRERDHFDRQIDYHVGIIEQLTKEKSFVAPLAVTEPRVQGIIRNAIRKDDE